VDQYELLKSTIKKMKYTLSSTGNIWIGRWTKRLLSIGRGKWSNGKDSLLTNEGELGIRKWKFTWNARSMQKLVPTSNGYLTSMLYIHYYMKSANVPNAWFDAINFIYFDILNDQLARSHIHSGCMFFSNDNDNWEQLTPNFKFS